MGNQNNVEGQEAVHTAFVQMTPMLSMMGSPVIQVKNTQADECVHCCESLTVRSKQHRSPNSQCPSLPVLEMQGRLSEIKALQAYI